MVKVRNEDVDAWDATHDPSGRSLNEDEDVVEVKEETLGDLKEQREWGFRCRVPFDEDF